MRVNVSLYVKTFVPTLRFSESLSSTHTLKQVNQSNRIQIHFCELPQA